MAGKPTVLVVGASRGLGLALAEEWYRRGWRVIATVREVTEGLHQLAANSAGRVEVEHVDIDQSESVKALRERLDGRTFDVLFLNAGIMRGPIDATPVTACEQDFFDMMLTNALAPVRAIELLGDLVPNGGVIAVMSSGLGSITNNTGGWRLYASSKAALHMLMKCFAARRPDDGRALLLVAPGWVRTEMGGPDATFSIEESIPHVVNTVAANRGKLGLRYLDRFNNPLPW